MSKKLTKEEVIEKAKKIHGNKYDYSKIEYVNYDTKITIICPKHGDFKIRPDHFLSNCGCPKCQYENLSVKLSLTTEDFIKNAKEVHGNKYDYSKVEYKNARTKVCIICPKHGEFWQTPSMHLRGHGCILCNESHLENEIEQLLKEKNIKYIKEKRFSWLRNKYPLPIDFYLPDYKIGIECQGEQHFLDKKFFKNYSLEERISLDLLKKELCSEHKITLLYYSKKYFVPNNWNKYEVICDKTKLLNNIK